LPLGIHNDLTHLKGKTMKKTAYIIIVLAAAAALFAQPSFAAAAKNAPAAKDSSQKSEIDAFAKKMCDDGKKGIATFLGNISFEFTPRILFTDEKVAEMGTTYKELGAEMKKEMLSNAGSDEDSSLAKCEIPEAKAYKCSDLFKILDGKENGFDVKTDAVQMTKAADAAGVTACGMVTLLTEDNNEVAEAADIVIGKIGKEWKMLIFFPKKEEKVDY